jgi:hypothetical protein
MMFERAMIAVVLAAAAAGSAAGDVALLNPAFPITVSSVAGISRFRADQNNWDHALIQGTNPVNAPSANVIGAGGAPYPLTAGRSYRFVMENVAGLGLRTSLTDVLSGTAYVQSWGDALLGGNNRATINGLGPYDAVFNTIHVYALVKNRDGSQQSRVTWSNLTFVGTGLTNSGTLNDGSLAPAAGDQSTYTGDNWIFTNSDLRTMNWAVAADVVLQTSAATPNPSENLKLEYSLKFAVPVPGAAAFLGLGLGVAARRRR